MSERELVVLGSSSQAPTRHRNHNGYLLRWDGDGILFDPGEGTQRQFTLAGVSAASVTRICITHFHGDHCLGLPGMIMRHALDQAPEPITVHYPASGERYLRNLRWATAGQEHVEVDVRPVAAPGVVHADERFAISCDRLRHRIESFGWRLEEPLGRHMLTDRLEAAGVSGPDVGRLLHDGRIELDDGRSVSVDEMSEPRPGHVFALVMDTAWCESAIGLAGDADLLVCESTFLSSEASEAARYGHLTAAEAGRLAREAGVRRLLLTHFSQRYPDASAFGDEAATTFDGEIVIAEDLMRVPLPPRR